MKGPATAEAPESSPHVDEMVALEQQLELLDAEIERFDAQVDVVVLQMECKYYALLEGLRDRERDIRHDMRSLHSGLGYDQTSRQVYARINQEMHALRSALEADYRRLYQDREQTIIAHEIGEQVDG
jgi:hypothetical protein